MDVGLVQVPRPGRSASMAQMAEENGFATLLCTDSQNLAPEVWSQLHLAAAATRHIALGPGVTSSVTRDPVVTASAALSLQAETSGRALVAIGRGDSAVQRLGQEPDPLASSWSRSDCARSVLMSLPAGTSRSLLPGFCGCDRLHEPFFVAASS